MRTGLLLCALTVVLLSAGCSKTGNGDAMEKTKFDSLYAQWQTHIAQPRVRVSSNPRAYVNCPPFRDIVGLGPEVLPHVIEKLRTGEASGWKESEFFLWRAAEEISGARLSAAEAGFSEQAMARRYIDWWEKSRKKP